MCSLTLAPQTMLNTDGEPDGYAVKVLQALAQRLDWPIKIEYFPWPRVAHMAQKGQCDIVLTVLMRRDYASYMVFPNQPILDQKNVIIVRKDSTITFDGNIAMFLRQHTVSMYRDKAIDDEFQRTRQHLAKHIQLTNTSQSSLQMLLLGRVDAVFENDLTAIMELKALGALDQVKLLQPPLNVTPAYITLPKLGRLAERANEFDAAMLSFKQTAAFKQIQQQYLAVERE
ncbi:transporter substrate-binding domain-containing protein [Pseudoalteromonas piscicida]